MKNLINTVLIVSLLLVALPPAAHAQRIYETNRATVGVSSSVSTYSYGTTVAPSVSPAPSGRFYGGSMSFFNGSLAPRTQVYQPFAAAPTVVPGQRRKAMDGDSDDDDDWGGGDNTGNNPGDIGTPEPIGAGFVLLLLAAVYAAFVAKKRHLQTPIVARKRPINSDQEA